MVVLTVQDDGWIQLPNEVCERFGLRPGTRLALEEENDPPVIHLRILSDAVRLVEKDGVWVLRFRDRSSQPVEGDLVSRMRAERISSLADPR